MTVTRVTPLMNTWEKVVTRLKLAMRLVYNNYYETIIRGVSKSALRYMAFDD